MKKLKLELKSFVKSAMKVCADIGSESHYIFLRHPCGKETAVIPFKNSRSGFEKLYELINKQKQKWQINNVVFGMESTGSYNDGVGSFLTERGIKVVLVNGFHTKRIKEISDNSPLKSDSKDPYVICDLMDLGHVMEYWKPEGPAAEIRQLNFFRERVIKKRTVAINQIKDLLISLFPEFEKAVGNIISKTAFYLIEEGFHDPDKIKNVDQNELSKAIFKISRGQKGLKTVKSLYNAAKTTIGIKGGKYTMIRSIIVHAKEIAIINKEIQSIEIEMEKLLDNFEYTKYLKSIKGVGLLTIACLVGEAGDFDRFHNIREVEKYAGLNLYEVSSGKYRGQRRITKRGRWYLRKMMYFCALNQVRCNPVMKEWYEDMKKRGKNQISGLIAVARKMLRLFYGIIKSKTIYDAEIWKKNIPRAA